MKKILSIGRAEYLQAVRSKAFLIGLFLMPVLMAGSIAVQAVLKDRVDLDDRVCVVVDPTGELWPALEAAARERNEQIFEAPDPTDGDRGGKPKQIRPRFLLERHVPEPGERPDAVLSLRAKEEGLQGFVLIDESVLEPSGEVAEKALIYQTEEPTFTELPRWIERVVNEEVLTRRFDAAGIDPELVATLNRRVEVNSFGLTPVSADGTVGEADADNKIRTFAVPGAAMFLLFMIVMTSAPQLMNQVLEEKMQRISEVLVSAVSPFELMMGKLLGSAGISLTLALVYLGGVAWSANHYGFADLVPVEAYLWVVVMILFALLMYGSLFSALGAACTELRDAQSMMMPAMILIMVPLFAWTAILESPNGSVAQALTYVPTATPMVLLIRLLAPPGPPLWEIVAGMGMCILATLVLVWASGKIFRIGVLAQGQAPSFRNLIGWVLSK